MDLVFRSHAGLCSDHGRSFGAKIGIRPNFIGNFRTQKARTVGRGNQRDIREDSDFFQRQFTGSGRLRANHFHRSGLCRAPCRAQAPGHFGFIVR